LLADLATAESVSRSSDQQSGFKGFEQLGNKDTVVVKLGGIYALEGVMNNSDQYCRLVLEGLAHLFAMVQTPPPGPCQWTSKPP
jgi:hypothetical protein